MKRLHFLFVFAFLVIVSCLSSCHKDGTNPTNTVLPNSNADSLNMIWCKVVEGVDEARFDITIGSEGQRHIDSLYLYYYPADDTTDIRQEKILLDTTFAERVKKSVKIGQLQPDSTRYCYKLELVDFFGKSVTKPDTLTTWTLSKPVAATDTAIIENSAISFYGTVTAHCRALLEDPDRPFKLMISYNTPSMGSELFLPINEYVQDFREVTVASIDLLNDTITIGYHCRWPLCDTLYSYKAVVQDSWGNNSENVMEKTVKFALPEVKCESHTNITDTSASVGAKFIYNGKDELGIAQRGVCFAETPNPVVGNDAVTLALDTLPMAWEETRTIQLSGLEPKTKYYYKVFVQLSDEFKSVFYSDEKSLTTKPR